MQLHYFSILRRFCCLALGNRSSRKGVEAIFAIKVLLDHDIRDFIDFIDSHRVQQLLKGL